ncbi:predicted protein [Phaeodactylum tricornutum CCAP 1055/1]|uniref:Uncharacterized protein n=1 Tax=Phaeodactylum tricornutum (strain CCAP 1055/1) TaxID=556484 RepID=B7S4H4_PHATC|nr:predicted protein [Phaeodactylum tricornutum CCAP 1055/1]EEC42547.1 predicted protein [Phaeodactylum tricornutum CCAP 1055/1]|eukprot:XP_002176467.1 predicted protein [Phaeodactylum tricornutum CCAP 1055/1]
MVPATRQMSSGAAYSHFLDNVFSLPQGHPIRLSFEQQGYNSVDDLLSIFLNELDALGYVPSAIDEIKQGVKRDKTHYPILKDDRYWDNFYRSFVVTAVSHNVEKVLDPSYAPTDASEKSLFEEQKKFVYSALEHTLQTDMGKNLVREHSFDFNAQEVFRKVVKHYTESASAKSGSSNTLAYLTTAKYGTSWTGTAVGFILFWKNHLCIYNDMVPMAEQLPKQLCLSLLENAVHDIPELRQVKITATLDLAKGGTPLNYKGNNLSNSRSVKSKRSAFLTDLSYDQPDFTEDKGIDYDIDLSLAVIYEANAHNRKVSPSGHRNRDPATNQERPYIPCEMWNQLSVDAKAILQGLPAPDKGPTRSGNVSQRALEANTHAKISNDNGEFNRSEPDNQQAEAFHDCDQTTELFAHLTDRVSHMGDGDIRKVLAASRRANGGLAGKVVNKTGRSASITGINEHTLSDLDIVTAAGFVESHKGPIIVIMHQYAYLGKGKTIHSSAQLEHYRNKVEDRSRNVGGQQRIVTLDDYITPLQYSEFESLPHVVLTSNIDWDPSILDNEVDMVNNWYDAMQDLPGNTYVEPRFDNTGQYLHRHCVLQSRWRGRY